MIFLVHFQTFLNIFRRFVTSDSFLTFCDAFGHFGHFWTFWGLLGSVAMFLGCLGCFRTGWDIFGCFGRFVMAWEVFGSFGVFWDVFFYVLAFIDILRPIGEF